MREENISINQTTFQLESQEQESQNSTMNKRQKIKNQLNMLNEEVML